MTTNKISTVFFDLGDTLGSASLAGSPARLVRFDAFPYARDVLRTLRQRGLKLGLISNTGSEKAADMERVLRPTQLLDELDAGLLVYSGDEGTTKASPEIFERAAARAGTSESPSVNLFVGENSQERAVAASAGWRVCPHPLLVEEVLAGQALRYVRLTLPAAAGGTPWREELQKRSFLPVHVAGRGGNIVYGIASQRVALELADLQFGLELIGDADLPNRTDLFLFRDDVATASGFLSDRGSVRTTFGVEGAERHVLSASQEGAIVALPPGPASGPSAFHFAGARHGHSVKLAADALRWATVRQAARHSSFADNTHGEDAALALLDVSAAEILDTVERYSGKKPLDGERTIKSRHIQHPGNALAVEGLAADLERIGQGKLKVLLHQFKHHLGTGEVVHLHNVEAELTGDSAELVLVTAHLDSTAGATPDPKADPAPGADDDASGMAAVLAIAKRFVALTADRKLSRTVRFVLFNCEEEGLVGSVAYARRSKARNESIAAVLQMDMIGYNKEPPQNWEVHAGFEQGPEVDARSRLIAELIRDVAPRVSPDLPTAQVYSGATPDGDPAAGRSDHAPFQAQGYAACVTSEDAFVGPFANSPAPEENPNYHSPKDTFVDPQFAASITRAVAAAAWLLATTPAAGAGFASASAQVATRSRSAVRELDTRPHLRGKSKAARAVSANFAGVALAQNAATVLGAQAGLAVAPQAESLPSSSLIERALSFAHKPSGFAGAPPGQFVPDSVVQRTSAGGAAVNLQQQHRGIPVFQMSKTVRFAPLAQLVDAVGDSAVIPSALSTEPLLSVEQAVLKAAQYLAETGQGETIQDQFGGSAPLPTIDIGGFAPQVSAAFALPNRPTVLEKGPFENPVPAQLMIFGEAAAARLAWHLVLTFPGYADQYVVIVAADGPAGELLYCRSTMRRAAARGHVFEFSPGIANRRMIQFPRPLTDYPTMPTTPLSGFPVDWVDSDRAIGNSTRATLNASNVTLTGSVQDGIVEFSPEHEDGDDQKLLNIFYFCNYMHDFLLILGFDEASGNFQQVNFTHTGSATDPVRARAHSGAVDGVANMTTGADGLPPLMNMGRVESSGRHTAFDADVVFHEYTHGLTNRLVGGQLNANALDNLQSGGLGEGWSDYYALTIQNYFRSVEKTVVGDWVLNDSAGIRRARYDDAYPFGFGDLSQSADPHAIGEVWCAALMMLTRKMRAQLGGDQQGYRLSWQIVTDGLKLTPANPTFLDARDAILQALDDLATATRISASTHATARRAAWEAFAHFGMGVHATSPDSNSVQGIEADQTVPEGI